MTKKKQRRSKKIRFRIKGKSSVATMFIVGLAFGFAMLLVSAQQFTVTDKKESPLPSYTCCDSGDGAACQPNPAKKLFYQGVKASAPEEYHLLKSNVYLRSQDHHIDPDPNGATNDAGERIFYNPRSEKNRRDWVPECISNISHPEKTTYDDFIYGPPPPGQSGPPPNGASGWCYAIPNEQLVYTCRSENPPGECDSKSGHARFDVYYRAADYAASGNPGIHNIIKNCVKPTTVPQGGTGQEIVDVPNPSDKPNLQLETFTIVDSPPVIDWISPFCKPAIYLYPQVMMPVSVQVLPKQKFTLTIPEYPQGGWNVIAYPNGKIVSQNNTYDYLYYETQVDETMMKIPETGYSLPYNELQSFLPELLSKLGLETKERKDFVDYWLSVLPKENFYTVKIIPQAELYRIAPFFIAPQPDTIIRVTLHFEATDTLVDITTPQITPMERKGFIAVEWGGIFKRDKNHKFSCFM